MLSEATKVDQKSTPHFDKTRICSHCKREGITFQSHLSIIAKRKKLRGSFKLKELHEILNDFNNPDVEVFCFGCFHFIKYKKCQCGNYRHIKKIEVEDQRHIPIYFTFCSVCAYEQLGINFDDYDYRQNEITLRRRS